MPKELTLTERKRLATSLVKIMGLLDLNADLEVYLIEQALHSPSDANVLEYRNLMRLVPIFMQLIHTVAHQGPIEYDGHTRDDSKPAARRPAES